MGLRLLPSLKAALDKAAKEERRPVASYVEIVLTDHLRAKGYLPESEDGEDQMEVSSRSSEGSHA